MDCFTDSTTQPIFKVIAKKVTDKETKKANTFQWVATTSNELFHTKRTSSASCPTSDKNQSTHNTMMNVTIDFAGTTLNGSILRFIFHSCTDLKLFELFVVLAFKVLCRTLMELPIKNGSKFI